MLDKIQACFTAKRVHYSIHARNEMKIEEFGRILEHEIMEMVESGMMIESYPTDKPYPSILIYGKTRNERPLHICCAHNDDDDEAVIVTAYHPDPEKWIDNIYRRKK
jgi:hypothetical protein